MIGTHTGPGPGRRDRAALGACSAPVCSPRQDSAPAAANHPSVSAPAAAPPPTPSLSHPRRSCAIVLTVVACVLALYLIYLLRKPLTWIFIAGFIAIALSGPGQLPAAPDAPRRSPSRSSTSG